MDNGGPDHATLPQLNKWNNEAWSVEHRLADSFQSLSEFTRVCWKKLPKKCLVRRIYTTNMEHKFTSCWRLSYVSFNYI